MTRTRRSLTIALSLALSTGALVAAGSSAHAQSCGMGDIDWFGAERVSVERAEELLRQGDPKEAARVLERMWPSIHEAVPVASSVPVIADGVRVMAIAAVRAGGDVGGPGFASATARQREANVAWGVRRLRMLAAALPGSAVVKTDLGEALARSPGTQEEAKEILEALDDTDEVATPEGYAALSLVRGRAGDADGSVTASAHCALNATNEVAECALTLPIDPAVTASR